MTANTFLLIGSIEFKVLAVVKADHLLFDPSEKPPATARYRQQPPDIDFSVIS
jgi:hypothetical protein